MKGLGKIGFLVVLISFFFLLNFLTEGRFFKFLFPFLEKEKQSLMCGLVSFFAQPFYKSILPLPSVDDILISFFISLGIFWIIRKIKSQFKPIYFLPIFIIVWLLFKYSFLILLYLLKCSQALEQVNIFGLTIRWDWFNIFWFIGAVISIIIGVKLLLSILKGEK
jgi:hypothetical protein